ncbi:MAG: HPP family protein [Gammaproteobacteria bacterium]|nr:HPP family protein [Gammaproteobacteria bacterium]
MSTLGGFIGITAVILVSHDFLGADDSSMIIASMGASSVLLFAVPHGPLSQPWAVLGGHTLSAFIGVTCGVVVPDKYIAAALAVGLSIGAMHYLRCIHPPGGATALTAVIGGGAIQSLGYQFVVTPVLINACVILIAAIGINFPFPARRYPLALNRYVDRLKNLRR